ncbi:transcriptional regulator GcvA [Variovorax beijingensis]|uniref:transcriptional regulator GcvA n=1 Tax=Variovorax beijingensis TaxID=2496117 RepID=UPI003F69F89B
MARQLPPMLSVRAFEAAARHGGFAKAAAELFVSPGAVAHQVRQLEEWLGVELFARLPRSVELTDAGRAYRASVEQVLEDLERASAELRRHADDNEVTVTAMPSFVTRWLMPRLGQFRAINPQIEVRVLASVPPAEFVRDRVDVAIRLGAGPYPGLTAEPLLDEHFFPVAAPALLAEHGAFASPRDLLGMVLLHDEFEPRIPEQIDWVRWFKAQGVLVPKRLQIPRLRFSHSYLTLDAAASKQGVAMASDVLASDAVGQGLLAMAWPGAVAGPYRYHLLQNKLSSAPRRPVQCFVEWVRGAAYDFRRAN